MYDPVLGRMLSPDNYISDAGSTQDYNRYSYAKNNPLLYTDPDGNNPIVGAIIGAVSYTLGVSFSNGGFKNWNWFGFASSVVVGAMTGGFASEIGGAVSAAVEAKTLTQFAAGAIQAGAYGAFGGTTSMLTAGSFVSGALTGDAGSAVGSLTGLIPGIGTRGWGTAVQTGSSATFGGVVSDLSGGDFWSGAALAAIIAGFNHAAHRMLEDDGPRKNNSKGNNYFGDRYTGPNNPDGYFLPPLNKRDAISMKHDQAYDKFKAAGLKGVLTDGYIFPADTSFTFDQIKLSTKLYYQGTVTPLPFRVALIYYRQSIKTFGAGLSMGTATTPKFIFNNPYKIP
jgi:hypothetical protein